MAKLLYGWDKKDIKGKEKKDGRKIRTNGKFPWNKES